jgi:hypothetical protein
MTKVEDLTLISTPGREASIEYEPCCQNKGISLLFRATDPDCTLSLDYLYRMYSVLVILPRLYFVLIELGLSSRAHPPYNLSFVSISPLP